MGKDGCLATWNCHFRKSYFKLDRTPVFQLHFCKTCKNIPKSVTLKYTKRFYKYLLFSVLFSILSVVFVCMDSYWLFCTFKKVHQNWCYTKLPDFKMEIIWGDNTTCLGNWKCKYSKSFTVNYQLLKVLWIKLLYWMFLWKFTWPRDTASPASRDRYCWRSSLRFFLAEFASLSSYCCNVTTRLLVGNTLERKLPADVQPSVAPRMTSTLSCEWGTGDAYVVGLRQKGGIVFTLTRKKVHSSGIRFEVTCFKNYIMSRWLVL